MREFGTTIFAEMSALAVATGSINLGQGFPDSDGPPELLDAAVLGILSGENQYPPGPGAARAARGDRRAPAAVLRADASTRTPRCWSRPARPRRSPPRCWRLCEPGDEVVTFEPYYDSYAASIALAGAVRRTVPLRWPEFAVDEAALRAAFSERTRLVLLNSPHNPTGKVFTRAELELVAALAVEHGAVVVTDEVYEHLVFDGLAHVPMATLPGMAERTLTISSAGKTFSVTGWKVGWVSGPAELVSAVRGVKQFLTFVASGPFQPAVATGLGLGDEVYAEVAASLQTRRDLLADGAGVGRASRCPGPAARTSSSPTPGRSGTTTGWRCAGRCPSWPASWPCR